MKGIILSGGRGTRLYPLTQMTSKQLLPVYKYPMIYYPLNTLIRAGIKDILIIVAPNHSGNYLNLLGSGKQFGVRFTYEVQDEPKGIAQAFTIGDSFVDGDDVTLILGDNIFVDDFSHEIQSFEGGCHIFTKEVPDPQRFGVAELDSDMNVLSIDEKPEHPKSNQAITGLYVFDKNVVRHAKEIKPSKRGELEITSLQDIYLKQGKIRSSEVQNHWIDAGTHDSLLDASVLVREYSKKYPFMEL